jgi:hypothetical protein
MTNKKFTNSFHDIFSPTWTQNIKENSYEAKTDENQIIRTTILLDKQIYNSIKAIAYWERCQIKDLINKAFENIIKSYSDDQINNMIKEFTKKNFKANDDFE